MNELIKIREENGQQLVSARELYRGLGLARTKWTPWSTKNIRKNEFFAENKDWTEVSLQVTGNDTIDFAITLEFAKHIAMMARTEKSHEYRNYFISCEKKLKEKETSKLPTTYKEALVQLLQQVEKNEVLELENAQQKQQIGELKPKADYTDIILKSNNTVTITQIAKDYGMSGKAMNKKLHDLKIQYKQSDQWLLYSKYHDCGYTKSVTNTYIDGTGEECSKLHTKWTQKGRLFLYSLLKDNGVLPLIER